MSNPVDSSPHAEALYRLLVEGILDAGVFMLDAEGRIASWNGGAQAITGYARDEIVGRPASVLHTTESAGRGEPAREMEGARTQGGFRDEGWRVRKDGSRFWAAIDLTPLSDDSGTFVGYAVLLRDLTDQRRQLERLRESEERLRLVVDHVKDYAIFLLAPDGTVASWNAGAQAIKGYAAHEIIGQHFSQFYPDEARERRWPEHELAVAMAEGRFEDENWRIRKDGSRFWANVVITALFDVSGQHRGFAKVTRDLTERRRIEELERSRRRQQEFLAMLSHELRNPLAPIRSAIDLISTTPSAGRVRERAIQVLDRQVSHLTRLVDDLLDITRVTQGRIALKNEPVALNTIIADAIEASRPLIESRRHDVTLDAPVDPVVIEGDDTRLTQVLVNLLNNAAKYTPAGGRIDVRLSQTADIGVIRVRDNGIGMSPELRAGAFELFVQGERHADRAEGGLGLGLTIARRLVEMHGGSIAAASDGPGRGSEFVVRLPLLNGK